MSGSQVLLDFICMCARGNQEVTERLQGEEKYRVFLQWMRDGGAQFPSLEYPVAFGQEGLIGVRALHPIGNSKAMLFIPYRLCLGIQAALSSLGKVFDALPDVFHDHKNKNGNRLYAFIMHERLKGRDSFYYPYFQVLPEPEILMDWSEPELKELQDPGIFSKVDCYKHVLDKYWKQLEHVFPMFPEEFPGEDFYEVFRWTYKVVQTRSFAWGDPEGMLIPLADCLNHGDRYVNYETCTQEFLDANTNNPITYVDYSDYSGTPGHRDLQNNTRACLSKLLKFMKTEDAQTKLQSLGAIWEVDELLPDDSSSDGDNRVDWDSSDEEETVSEANPQTPEDYFVISTGVRGSYAAGEEVFNCYGRQSNLGLLMFYGFALEHNYRDAVFLDFAAAETRLPAQYKLKFGRLNEDVINYFRKELVSALTQEGVLKPNMSKVLGVTPVLPMIEIPTLQRVLSCYQSLISIRFPTTQEFDQSLLLQNPAPRLRTAIAYRLSQKRIFQSQVEQVQLLLHIMMLVKSGTWEHCLRDKSGEEIKAIYPLRRYLRSFQVNQTLWEKSFFK